MDTHKLLAPPQKVRSEFRSEALTIRTTLEIPSARLNTYHYYL
jgi:hypothetical protein